MYLLPLYEKQVSLAGLNHLIRRPHYPVRRNWDLARRGDEFRGERWQTKSDKALFTRLMIAKSILSAPYTRKRLRIRVSRSSHGRLNGLPSWNSLGDCLIKLIDSNSSCRHKSRAACHDANARHCFHRRNCYFGPRPNDDGSYSSVYSTVDHWDSEGRVARLHPTFTISYLFFSCWSR